MYQIRKLLKIAKKNSWMLPVETVCPSVLGLSYSGLIFAKFLKIIISIYNQNKPSHKLIFVKINFQQPFSATEYLQVCKLRGDGKEC